jgi:acylphosphatase
MNNILAEKRSTLHLVIYGRVQGVFFRESMRRTAQDLAVTGWVRNRNDGTVEAVVQGEQNAVEAIVRWAQLGPKMANVERIEVEPCSGSFTNFEVIR